MPRFRVIRGGLDDTSSADRPRTPHQAATDPLLARRLRGLYAPPGDGYWDGLEATVMAAVRAGRAAPAAAAEWWHTLARWARPGLAAAAVVIGVVGGVAMQSRGARVTPATGTLVEEPASTLVPLDEEFARAADVWSDSASAGARAEARAAADLLSDGVKRRRYVPFESDGDPTRDSAQARREAMFRYVMP